MANLVNNTKEEMLITYMLMSIRRQLLVLLHLNDITIFLPIISHPSLASVQLLDYPFLLINVIPAFIILAGQYYIIYFPHCLFTMLHI